MAFKNPFAKPLLVILQRQIPVGGFLLDRLRTAELALRIDELVRTESTSTLFALITISPLGPTFRARTDYISVRQESLGLRVIILLALPSDKLPFVVKFLEEVRSILGMRLGGCSSVDIEIDAKSGEGILDYLVVLVHNILWGASLLPRLDSNRHAMLI